MRSIYYLATVIKSYREIIDKIKEHNLTEEDKKYYKLILDRVANRDSVPQFYSNFPGYEESYFQDRVEVSNQDFLGLVLGYDEEKKLLKIEERNYFKIGDEAKAEFNYVPGSTIYAYCNKHSLWKKDVE